jgi:hypothetical protein
MLAFGDVCRHPDGGRPETPFEALQVQISSVIRSEQRIKGCLGRMLGWHRGRGIPRTGRRI